MYILLQLTIFYALLQIKTFTCLILVIDFCIYKCNWQILLPLFLYASLQITHFVKTTAIDLLFNLLWWTFSVSSISMYDNFILHYCNYNEQLLYSNLKVFINYKNSEQFIRHIFLHHCKSCNWGFLHTIVNHKLFVQHCNVQFCMNYWYC